MNIPKLKSYVLKSIFAELVVQSAYHADNIRELYRMIHDACRKEFMEDNIPTLDGFLFELFKDTQGEPDIFVSMYDAPPDYIRPNNFTRYSTPMRDSSCDNGEYVLWQDFRELELRFIALSQYQDRLHKQRINTRSGSVDLYASTLRNKDPGFKAQCIDETAAFDEAAFENLTPENRAVYDRAQFIKTPLHLKFEYLYDQIEQLKNINVTGTPIGVCSHGRRIDGYCEPCGRIHSA